MTPGYAAEGFRGSLLVGLLLLLICLHNLLGIQALTRSAPLELLFNLVLRSIPLVSLFFGTEFKSIFRIEFNHLLCDSVTSTRRTN